MKQSGTTKKTARKTGKRVSELEGLATRTGVRQQTSGLIRIGAQISRMWLVEWIEQEVLVMA